MPRGGTAGGAHAPSAPLPYGALNTGRCPRAGCGSCENPVVVAAAADELGARCQPLVCVGGQPSAAGWRLLELLAAGGAEFDYHGDFDWGGVRIARAVRRPGELAAVALRPPGLRSRGVRGASGYAASGGEPAETPWDPELAVAMRRRSIRIEEELTLDVLLQDLIP